MFETCIMKKILFLFVLSITFDFFCQSTPIPDSNFEQALVDLNIDTDGLNGSILNSDAEQQGILDVSYKNINDLSGIEAFINLVELDCSINNLTSLDLFANTLLVSVSAFKNNLVDINLNNIQALYGIDVSNNQLDSLDFSNHPTLYYLMCYTNNLTYLNISSNSNLGYLSCAENQLTGSLDISNFIDLEFFVCRVNQLSEVIIGIHPDMSIFNCQNNNLTELNLSNCFSLEEVHADSNALIALNLQSGSNSLINELHAEGNPNLYCILVDDPISSNINPNWTIDNQSSYSEECDWAFISDLEYSKIKLLPNPANDWLLVKINNPQRNQIELSDINGKILQTQSILNEETLIDIRDLSKGTYLIKIGQSVERLVKN